MTQGEPPAHGSCCQMRVPGRPVCCAPSFKGVLLVSDQPIHTPAPSAGLPHKCAAMACTLGYGVVCGLIFPLMISSTFLQAMSLSHGAGNSFGLLFFCAYTIAMGLCAIAHCSLSRIPGNRVLIAALACAFAGNALMLGRHLEIVTSGWPYAIATAILVGCGLALAELGWLVRLAELGRTRPRALVRGVPLAYLVGCLIAAFIFCAAGPIELTFALAIIVASGVPLFTPILKRPTSNTLASVRRPVDLVKAVSYLAVFSFVFGTVSQVSTTERAGMLPIEAQALLGIVIAALVMVGASLAKRTVLPVNDLYGVLFPIVALTLVALPFIEAPALHVGASILVFVAFYLTGINVRVIVCQLGRDSRAHAILYASIALGVGALCILAGVALGAGVLRDQDLTMGLAFISLVSLFVLSLNSVLARALEKRSTDKHALGAESPGVQPAPCDASVHGSASRVMPPTAPRDAAHANNAAHSGEAHGSALPENPTPAHPGASGANPAVDARTAAIVAFAAQHDMTARESEVLALVCQGRTRTYIADELGISPNTVKGYIHAVYQKAGAANKQDLLDRVEVFSAARA